MRYPPSASPTFPVAGRASLRGPGSFFWSWFEVLLALMLVSGSMEAELPQDTLLFGQSVLESRLAW